MALIPPSVAKPVNITEAVVNELTEHMKSTYPTFLGYVRASRDKSVNITPPETYLNYFPAHAFKATAVFVICDDTDFDLGRGQNHINAGQKFFVNIVVEERDQDRLQKKVWRYMDAAFKCLDQARINVENDYLNLSAIVKVSKFEYSGDYAYTDDSSSLSNFRKEVMIELKVEQFQQN